MKPYRFNTLWTCLLCACIKWYESYFHFLMQMSMQRLLICCYCFFFVFFTCNQSMAWLLLDVFISQSPISWKYWLILSTEENRNALQRNKMMFVFFFMVLRCNIKTSTAEDRKISINCIRLFNQLNSHSHFRTIQMGKFVELSLVLSIYLETVKAFCGEFCFIWWSNWVPDFIDEFTI